ncbi:unnamed protein product [Ambrosiozyma monospora]|uniref:Unnamed protein product n=1 Tax=Ambrosiozyma monospora TaxID=43982 RepID=A0ACB5SWV0_AMBMO|nr:unnamed protein product [Ambrosiozyma monospora]
MNLQNLTSVPKGKRAPLSDITNIANNKKTPVKRGRIMKPSRIPRLVARPPPSLFSKDPFLRQNWIKGSRIPIPSRYINKHKSDWNIRVPHCNKRNTDLSLSTLTTPTSAKLDVPSDEGLVNGMKVNQLDLKLEGNDAHGEGLTNDDCAATLEVVKDKKKEVAEVLGSLNSVEEKLESVMVRISGISSRTSLNTFQCIPSQPRNKQQL